MKIPYKMAALLAGASLLLSSCIVDGTYGTFGVSGPGYNASVAWSNASYDANGFPIFGYSYGQPVYGYTPSGAAVFSFAALTALCFVPQWGPAPWYRGSWHYPPRIHRVSAPPRYPSGHRPHERPHGGMNAPIHHNPPARPATPNTRPGTPGHRGPGANMPARPATPDTRPGTPGHRGPGANMPTRPTTPGTRPPSTASHIVRPSSAMSGTRPPSTASHIVRPSSAMSGTRHSNSASHIARPGSGANSPDHGGPRGGGHRR